MSTKGCSQPDVVSPIRVGRFKALIRDASWDSNLLPEIAPHAGHKSGLSILIDMKPSEMDVESSISNDFNGVEVNVGTKHTFPRSRLCSIQNIWAGKPEPRY